MRDAGWLVAAAVVLAAALPVYAAMTRKLRKRDRGDQ